MSKTDLLKEAIADAKAVRNTALANAKIALEEAFAPRLSNMLAARISEELEDDELPAEEAPIDGEASIEAELEPAPEAAPEPAPEMDMAPEAAPEAAPAPAPAPEMEMEPEMPAEEPSEDDLDLEAVIRELEGMDEPEMNGDEEMPGEEEMPMEGEYSDEPLDEDIERIISEILGEQEEPEAEIEEQKAGEDGTGQLEEVKAELDEAYDAIAQLKSVLSEVNLLNAKLLYTNKLFRTFDLNESQKMKVIENFDRTSSTREVQLVFTTLAENFNVPRKSNKLTESRKSSSSNAVRSTKPTTKIITEGNDMVSRWQKLSNIKKS